MVLYLVKMLCCHVFFYLQCFVLQNKWVPRRVDNNPKTIDQIHKEVAQENQEKALLAQQAQLQQKTTRGGGTL